jgi:hypothetical protein
LLKILSVMRLSEYNPAFLHVDRRSGLQGFMAGTSMTAGGIIARAEVVGDRDVAILPAVAA